MELCIRAQLQRFFGLIILRLCVLFVFYRAYHEQCTHGQHRAEHKADQRALHKARENMLSMTPRAILARRLYSEQRSHSDTPVSTRHRQPSLHARGRHGLCQFNVLLLILLACSFCTSNVQ